MRVLDPGKGVCADPRGRDAVLGEGWPGPPVGAGEPQLSPDRGGVKRKQNGWKQGRRPHHGFKERSCIDQQ